ncbi:hypothetical protein E2C00_27570 [Streptomyces sp. WAC05374]|uniref:DUF6251 family protein n=1 Tax=Streptomyces sp. WAC05374 TaxID=2487420 RepID=UPI000F87B4BB|nr:DUF6251 family protein [Streptomyces sp. WAC05374]RST18543.1 hypothetical protein EF905_04865 [Streptomyces sp. WAC05374]TDF43277.1 hypothetical protein E2B92_20425 [Streptomyces sp. WAC05374]TDF51063.1 hypothetical protein E2C00_27570 [Streptomyces sp. WAC05374]TDF52194.1 hypothetical protein E2C02_21595 [Streptomyces sp. WAC05374]
MDSQPEIARVVQLPDGRYVYADPASIVPAQQTGPQIVHQHIHQAAPDRTVQRIALGSGVGAGAVAAGVYFGPLLVGALTAIAANLAILAFLAVALTWGVVTVVRTVGGAEGAAAVRNVRRSRRRR